MTHGVMPSQAGLAVMTEHSQAQEITSR
jgi:hypothetical protein